MRTLIRTSLIFLLFTLTSQMVRADEYDDAIQSFKNAGESGAYFEANTKQNMERVAGPGQGSGEDRETLDMAGTR